MMVLGTHTGYRTLSVTVTGGMEEILKFNLACKYKLRTLAASVALGQADQSLVLAIYKLLYLQ